MYIFFYSFILQNQNRFFALSTRFLSRKKTLLRKQDPFFLTAFHFSGTPLLSDDSRTLSDELVETSINHGNAATLRDEIARVSRHQLRNRPRHVAFVRKVRPLKLNSVFRVPFALFPSITPSDAQSQSSKTDTKKVD